MSQVLVAVKDTDLRATLRLLLEEPGYAASEARDLATTLRALLASPCPLVVLLDSHLPGCHAAERILSLAADVEPIRRHTYVLCTTYSEGRLPRRLGDLVKAHSVPVIYMPFDLDEFFCAVDRAEEELLVPLAR
jgi:DNA-binding NtrC family response regulator